MRRTFVARIALGLLLCVSTAHGLAADTYPRQPGVDALHYVFRLTITDLNNEIAGESTVTVRFATAGTTEVALDLVKATGDKGMSVSAVTCGGRPAAFAHEADRLRITLASPPAAASELSCTTAYRGVPAGGLRIINNIHGERTAFSENWPNNARHWLPMIDHPYDKATGEFIVTAPAHYQVVANGLLMEETDVPGGARRTHWKQSVPIASWLYAVGMARFTARHYATSKGVPQQVWVFPQDAETGQRIFELTGRRAFDYFSEQIGPYAYEKLAHVQAAGLGGGTEHATVIFYGEKGVASGNAPVVHEVAHQWWGNAVTERDWDDVWLSEGFATYFTLLYTEQFDGRDAFVRGLRSSRDRILQLEKKTPNTPIIHRNLSDMRRVLNQFVYQKGGWTLHMLRHNMGTERFWDGIREYLPPLSEPQRLDRRPPRRYGARRRQGPALVLRSVADAQRRAGAHRQLALRCRRATGHRRALAGPDGRAVSATARVRDQRAGDDGDADRARRARRPRGALLVCGRCRAD